MEILKRFWRRYCATHLRSYGFGLLFLLATTGLTVAVPGFVEMAVDAMEEQASSDAVAWAIAIIAAGLGIMVVRTLSRVFFFIPGREIEFALKSDLFGRLTRMPRPFYDRVKAGEIVSRGTNDAGMVRVLVGFGTLQMFNVALTILLTVGKMALTNALLTLLCVVPLIAAAAVLRRIIRSMFGLTRRTQEQMATLSDRVLESYNGAAVLQSFNAMGGARDRFDEANTELLDLGLAITKITAWGLPIVQVMGNLCLVIILYAGGTMVVDGDMSKAELAAFVIYIRIVVGGLTSMGWMVNVLQRGWISLKRVYEVMDARDERLVPTAEMPPTTRGGYPIAVDGLTFGYAAEEARPGRARPALEDVSFHVAAGETVGIFGLTGSGKSTLLQLLARLHEPPPGAVRLAGVDVRELPIEAYWRSLAYVPQDPFLFSETLRENIALSAPAGERDDERVVAAADDAALTDDLGALSDGLDTVVGERGITLSGGQRQRTAIARAFYRDFDVLLLDDVLSAVDHATEKRLIEAIYRRAAGGTTLVVSHRVSVLRRADRILVLDEGRLVAEGTHEALVARDGIYAKTWRLQQARERAKDLEPTAEPPADGGPLGG